MSDLIRKNDAINLVTQFINLNKFTLKNAKDVGKLIEYLFSENRIKAIDAVEVVRCKDCKHCHYEQEDDVYHCHKLFHRFYDTEHYCSYGERKTDHE